MTTVRPSPLRAPAESRPAPLVRLPRPAVLMRGVLGFVLFFVALELLSRFSGLSQQTLPRATTMIVTMAQVAVDPAFYAAAGATLSAAAIGLLIAVAVAVPLGVILGSSLPTYRAMSALIELIRPVPSVAVIPVALLLFGFASTMKIFLVVFAALWIVLFNTIYAVRDVDPVLKDMARVYGVSRLRILLVISLRSALPFIYTGLRIAVTAALIVTISAELLAGGGEGLGRWLRAYEETGNQRQYVFAGAFMIGVIGVLLNFLLDVGERRLFPWSIAVRDKS